MLKIWSMAEGVLMMEPRKDSYIIDRRPGIDYLNIHDTDVVDILKDMIRRAEKNE